MMVTVTVVPIRVMLVVSHVIPCMGCVSGCRRAHPGVMAGVMAAVMPSVMAGVMGGVVMDFVAGF